MGEVSCAVNKAHETREMYVTQKVGTALWRIPVWVCVDPRHVNRHGT